MPESNTQLTTKQRRYQKLKRAAVCVSCTKWPAEEGKAQCHTCLVSRRTKHRARMDAHQCRYCDSEAEPGKTQCDPCRDRTNAWKSGNSRKRREAWRAEGLCTTCGRPVEEGRPRCRTCRLKQNEQRKRWNKKVKDAAFEAYGGYKCACCGEAHEEME